MQNMKVTAQRGTEPPVEVDFEMSDNMTELVAQFGEEIVFSHARRSIVIALQGYMRSLMDQGREKGEDPAAIANSIVEAVKTWKPSQKKAPRTVQEKARDILSKLSPADRAQLLKEYRKSAAAAAEQPAG